MADVIGPNRYLPGQRLPVPEGMMCDDHPDVPAVARIVGETDSFGSELMDLCQACVDEMTQHKEEEHLGCCDWCKKGPVRVYPHRDSDEGTCGPVYDVCVSCIDAENARIHEELSGSNDDDDDLYGG